MTLLLFRHICALPHLPTAIFSVSSVLCLSADHIWRRSGSGGVWIFKQRQGTFMGLLYIYGWSCFQLHAWYKECYCFWDSFIYLLFAQIIEDVQNFYTSKYNDNNNGTLILTYQKIVSVKSSISCNTMFLLQHYCLAKKKKCWLKYNNNKTFSLAY